MKPDDQAVEQARGYVATRWLGRRVLRLLPVVVLGGCLLFGAGCATPGMKGTPFYTGEPSEQEKLAAERVYVWPLLYYRSPGLSVCWPLFTAYGVEPTNRVYNVVWPLAQFDRQEHQNRIFPYFWGGGADPADDYRIGFPLYWHFGHPLDKEVGGWDALFPLWCVDRQGPDQSSVYCPWPLVHFMHDGQTSGWHVFPLAGSYGDGNEYFRFQAAFLADQWGNERDAHHGSLVLPLYLYGQNKGAWDFYSLPWSGGHEPDHDWSCLLPVYYHRTNTTGALFLSPLWLQGSSAQPAGGGWAVLVPLLYHSHSAQGAMTLSPLWLSHTAADTNQTSWSALLPVYYHSANKEAAVWLTPLWMQGRSANPAEGGWAALFPLAFHSYNDKSATTLSPLWLSHTAANPQEKSWSTLLPVYYHGAQQGADLLLTPLWAQGTRSNASWQCQLPFYFARQEGADQFWATPLGGLRTAAGRRSWMIYPLLSWGRRHADGGEFWALAPLIHADWNASNSVSHLLPFYYYNSGTHTALSPLWARWTELGCTNALVPPALSWVSSDAASSDLWLALGLGKFSWGAQPGSQYLMPLFYQDRERQQFLSLLWAGWPTAGGRIAALPPALSWKETRPERSDLHLLLCLGQFSWGDKPGAQYLLPFFYQNSSEHTFLSPVWAQWLSAGGTNTAVPLALSWLTADERRKNLWLALGLGKFSWGAQPGSSYLLPVYYHDPQSHEFYTPLYGRDPGVDGYTYFATPLVGQRQGAHTGSWAFPLYSHKREVQSGDIDDWLLWGNHWERDGISRSVFFPVFGYHNFGPLDSVPGSDRRRAHFGKDFFCIPYCWYRNETYLSPAPEARPRPAAPTRMKGGAPLPHLAPVREDKFTHGVFPLWSYANVEKPAQGHQTIDGSCLLWLYNYNREISPLAYAPAGTNDFTCARFLWHFWYYERLNGDVSVDLFPGITYDRKRDGFKKYSWLWRFFRYERDKDGGKKLDLLFIPLMRTAGGGK